MPSFLAVLAIAAGTFWFEAPGLIRRKHTRELVVFILFLLIATTLYCMLTLKVILPNPFALIKLIYGWIEA
ncbi:hypothetical protein A8709_17865 [Paenibacillus pectinilyticus]|uniref:Uncharacterized protein n=1 Tax=Paenibacillus pectinilyticus TaxID=512399 RepID=A0A1C0ZZB0_9BACL|nr:hypothetical protein A8709_17865 [Paenibacillus pectinilyticus]